MAEKIVKSGSVELFTESFGNPDNPCILLMMGAMASMVWWDEDFCSRLSEGGRFVIRYDNRDVGRSTCYEPGLPPYNVLDMADDALAILDAYGIEKAHLIGMSLGGMLAQILAIRNPERVLTLTVIASSVWDDSPELPGIDPKILDYHQAAGELDWQDADAVRKYLIGGWRILGGSRHSFDEAGAAQLAAAEYARARNLLSMFNHAALGGGEAFYGMTASIGVPSLVVHGTEDPVLPFGHGLKLQNVLKNARLLALEGAGHELHRQDWDAVIDAVLELTGPGTPQGGAR